MRHARAFVDRAAQAGRPFFAYLAVYAPHSPATPAPQDDQAFPGLQAPRDGAFNEIDVADKPAFIQQMPLLSARAQANIDNLVRRRAQSLQAVDRGVAALVDALNQNGQLANTYIIFTSDNGFHLGQHRMQAGKMTAYEPDIHLPLLVRGPGISAGAHVSALTGNVDIAPTIAALAGATMSHSADGRSLVPFLHGTPTDVAGATPSTPAGVVPPPGNWRQAYLLEHWTAASEAQDRSGAALEPDDPDQGGTLPGEDTSERRRGLGRIPEFQGLRTATTAYVEYESGERELYDLIADPDELNNMVATADPALVAALHTRLDLLRHCAGDSCREAESQPLSMAVSP